MNHHDKQNSILRFWFGEDSLHPLTNSKMWFSKDHALDEVIRTNFGAMLDDAGTGAFDDWARTYRGALALVILCDQFPRNIFRGEDQAFAYDQRALRASQIAVDHGFDKELNCVERCFLYLPFEHAENIDVQSQSVELFSSLLEDAQGEELAFINEAIRYAKRHHEIIEKFGRFPHRNEMLGRESTREEKQFLKQPGSYF